MAIARYLDRMSLAFRASWLWLRYATLQNLIPSFPWKGSNFAIWQPCVKLTCRRRTRRRSSRGWSRMRRCRASHREPRCARRTTPTRSTWVTGLANSQLRGRPISDQLSITGCFIFWVRFWLLHYYEGLLLGEEVCKMFSESSTVVLHLPCCLA